MIRVLLVADTHIGVDLPLRPRVERRRRGYDFLANFERALQPALRGEVDLVVHGGDLLDRARVPDRIVEMAMAPLLRVAKQGVPVFLVPGNHERRRIPLRLWTVHPQIHIFREPTTFVQPVGDVRVALAGFPSPRDVCDHFSGLVERTRFQSVPADVRLLCVHAAVEGAQVGVQNYTFRYGPQVVRGRDVPAAFAAVLAGHIHRQQLLGRDLSGRGLGAPVIYPGSVERTAFAEREEEKGYLLCQFLPSGDGRGSLVASKFVPLPTRPMVSLMLQPDAHTAEGLRAELRRQLAELHPDAVVRVQVQGTVPPESHWVLSASNLRTLAPQGMNVTVSYPFEPRNARAGRRTVQR